MKLLEQNCSLIISKANQWLDKNKDRSQLWIDYNFPAMFLHLCKGNSEFNFLKDIGHHNVLRNRNFRYKVENGKLVEIKFVSLYSYYYSDNKLDTVNEAFRLTLPVTFGLDLIPQSNHKVVKQSRLGYRYTDNNKAQVRVTPQDKESLALQTDIQASQRNLNNSMSKLQNFFTN